MISLAIKIGLLVILLRMGKLLTGGVLFWQKGLIYGGLNLIWRALFVLGYLGDATSMAGFSLMFVLIGILEIGGACAYFYGVDKIPGRFNLPFVVLGGIVMVLFL